MNCSYCGRENNSNNERCDFCGAILQSNDGSIQATNYFTKEETVKLPIQEQKESSSLLSKGATIILKVVIRLITLPTIFIGTIFIIFSIVSMNEDYQKSKDYVQTTANFSQKINCTSDGLCQAIYKYEVDGQTYDATPDQISNNFPKTKNIKYDPTMPNIYIIDSGWKNLLYVGIVMDVIAITIIIAVNILLKRSV